jgi:hypothetical protein
MDLGRSLPRNVPLTDAPDTGGEGLALTRTTDEIAEILAKWAVEAAAAGLVHSPQPRAWFTMNKLKIGAQKG